MIHLQFLAYGSWDSLFPISMSPNCKYYESRSLFFKISLKYYCILGLAEIKTFIPEKKLCEKDAGCAGKNITAHTMQKFITVNIFVMLDQKKGHIENEVNSYTNTSDSVPIIPQS